ncbi:MAG TPA: bifunctional (p)ppGpp synthetase/guanosine-3',5'-bis(diphosphate) 3'-pyrophosphohydrolase, partial [Thermoleophilaceae bacterium]|nr:bifunctional (p)ppGpp synthetase/guanosine-3',5'-bis(diphosphate) 3'-pyrophosphohydrolase [Thermoleophilaceae bacterium]
MPKLPRTGGKASTSERAKKPAAQRAAGSGAKAKPAPASKPKQGTRTTSKRPRSAAKPAATTAKKKPASNGRGNGRAKAPERDFRHRPVDTHDKHRPAGPKTKLTDAQRVLLGDLFAVVEEHRGEAAEEIDRDAVERAFLFSCERHADQRRASGEDFIVHPVGVAKICAGMRLDTATLCAALLHDTVEDTSASLDEVQEEFGDEIAQLVDGLTKLSGVTFQSRDDRQAENYRKMMVAMARDIRVILIKLADRLHNMRTIGSMPKNKQQEKARETLEIFAPLAHRLGIHAIKWELEDLAFTTLHPRKYNEIRQLVSQQREERDAYVERAGEYLGKELKAVGIDAEISGRAKHFYSIYSKMTKKGREFNEIYDLTAMRVIVDSVKDCYGAIGVIHSLWKPLPGRFKDWVAMPKFNMYQALHTTVIGPEGRPLEIQIRTMEMHRTAEFGVAAHWIYKEDGGKPLEEKVEWLRHLLDWQQEMADPQEFAETLKADLFEDEVFVFTPKGEVKSLGAGATPLDFAYEIHTDVGHRCVGAKVNGKIVPLHYELQSGDICEVLTSKKERGPSRDWLALAKTTRAQSKIRAWFKRERREDSERAGREILQESLKRAGLPPQKMAGSPLLADVIREMGFRKGEDFYIAL